MPYRIRKNTFHTWHSYHLSRELAYLVNDTLSTTDLIHG